MDEEKCRQSRDFSQAVKTNNANKTKENWENNKCDKGSAEATVNHPTRNNHILFNLNL